MDESDCGAVGTATVQQGSDDANNVELCEQCQESELSVVASTFCSDCDDFLCDDCADQHRKLRATKKHNLLEGNIVPKIKPRVTGEHGCSEHPGETIKLYCQSDRVLGCVLCIAESHRTCPDVRSISKLSKDIGMSKELKDFKLSIEKQNAELVSYKQILDEYHILNDKWCDQSVKEFETFKTNIETLLDAMGKEVYSQAEEVKEKNNNEMKAITELLESIEQVLESLTHGIEWSEIRKQTERLFVEVKRGIKHIEENVKKLDQIKDGMQHIQRYKFEVNQKLQHMIDELANVVSSPLQVISGDLECTAEINIKSPEDSEDSSVMGLAEISADEMMVADAANKCLKLVHVDSKTIVQRRPLLSPPHDVVFIPDNAKVAVLLPDEHEVQYFSADKQIHPCGNISVDGECTSVQYSKGTLVVLFDDPGKIRILDLGGSILRSFTTDTAGNELFDGPSFLCLSQDLADIYVSDNRTTLSLSAANGHVSWKYTNKYARNVDHEDSNRRDNLDGEDENTPGKKDEAQPNEEYEVIPGDEDEDGDECFDPAGIASGDDGCLYVCSQETNCIHVISAAGIELRVIPVDKFKLFSPFCVCYNKDRDALYVSSFSDDPDHCNFIRRLSFTSSK